MQVFSSLEKDLFSRIQLIFYLDLLIPQPEPHVKQYKMDIDLQSIRTLSSAWEFIFRTDTGAYKQTENIQVCTQRHKHRLNLYAGKVRRGREWGRKWREREAWRGRQRIVSYLISYAQVLITCIHLIRNHCFLLQIIQIFLLSAEALKTHFKEKYHHFMEFLHFKNIIIHHLQFLFT